MSDGRGDATFRVAAVGALILGVLLLFSSWDGLYDSLDLPKPTPALTAQIGGASLLGLALLLWSAPGSAELRRVAARAGVIAYGGGAAVIAAWLIFRDAEENLGIDTLGTVLLIVAAVVLAALAAGMAQAARPPRAPE